MKRNSEDIFFDIEDKGDKIFSSDRFEAAYQIIRNSTTLNKSSILDKEIEKYRQFLLKNTGNLEITWWYNKGVRKTIEKVRQIIKVIRSEYLNGFGTEYLNDFSSTTQEYYIEY